MSAAMASRAAAPAATIPLGLRGQSRIPDFKAQNWVIIRRNRQGNFRVYALQDSNSQKKAPSRVDTRIHWENDNEGWLGESSNSQSTQDKFKDEKNILSEKFSDLLNSSSDSYYQFLGVAANADMEEIKAAYRKLSKEYHPDTTELPLKAASEKFMKLREVYDVLSNEEKRKFYDWSLAQEVASREAEKMRMRLEDPYMQDVESWESIPDTVDRLGGRNMELSDQAKSALTFDILTVAFSVCCILYAIFFKESY